MHFPAIHRSVRLDVESLEDRLSPATFTVKNDHNSGLGSLRAAINQANATLGADYIQFHISGAAVHRIDLLSALPAIREKVTINASSQPGFTGTPRIELNGTSAGVEVSGLVVRASGSVVKGLAINRFAADGLRIRANNCLVAGCYIGTDAQGSAALGNGLNGVSVFAGVKNAKVGGDGIYGANVLSSNGNAGVMIGAATDNLVKRNHIGLSADGSAALPNAVGVILSAGATGNLIGGIGGNVISGNAGAGVSIVGAGTSENTVLGNRIGTNPDGTAALANGGDGVSVGNGAGSTQIVSNQISGNIASGVKISGNNVTDCVVSGNLIGLNAAGTMVLSNGRGVLIADGATNNRIGGVTKAERNVISGNGYGVMITDAGTSFNTVEGNFIGTDVTGTLDRENPTGGVGISNGASNNTVGGLVDGARNIIAGSNAGLDISGAGTSNNAVLGNYIGTDVTGTQRINSSLVALRIWNGASNNLVGDGTSSGRNVISGNRSKIGIDIRDAGTSGNIVQGNYVGTDGSGTIGLGASNGVIVWLGATNNTIGGTSPGAGNLISDNAFGVIISNAAGNSVQGNYVGTDVTGTTALGNGIGVGIGGSDSENNIIGGTAPGAKNVISGNSFGVTIDLGAHDNYIQGNYIGLDNTGVGELGNLLDGLDIKNSAFGNLIGGLETEAGNIIAYNGGAGIAVGFAAPSSPVGNGNNILGNSIFDNGGLGIDLGPVGSVTPNDSDDADNGPNNLINFPILTAAVLDGTNLTISGSINTEQNKTLRLEFFANPTADPSGFGEGQTFLGFVDVTMGANNTVNFSQILSGSGLTAGQVITATATDELGNTSEFSLALTVT